MFGYYNMLYPSYPCLNMPIDIAGSEVAQRDQFNLGPEQFGRGRDYTDSYRNGFRQGFRQGFRLGYRQGLQDCRRPGTPRR